MSENAFVCSSCGTQFEVKPDVLARYPGWRPSMCWPCKNKKKSAGGRGGSAKGKAKSAPRGKRRTTRKKGPEELLSRQQVLDKYTDGPLDGVFTDGACSGNPGPGGWGVVQVSDDTILTERFGSAERTTNNRMEMTALIEAYRLLPEDAETTIWSDSNLCVRTLNEWAAGWKKRGWKRKTGPVENLDLVQEAYDLHVRHPGVTLRWIKAHNGSRYNEYADCLATSYLRPDAASQDDTATND